MPTMPPIYSQFFRPGEVVELRGLGLRGKNPVWEGYAGTNEGTVYGYYNHLEKLQADAMKMDKAGARGVYFTINPCIEPIFARAANRLVVPHKGDATKDDHIALIRWFLVDLDAPLLSGDRRPKGISATADELTACKAKAEEVAKYLEDEHGFARALRCFSGNGYHLNYRLPDLPNDVDHRNLVRDAMAALVAQFGDVTIDVSVVNPSRIWKFYGTTGRKGDSTDDRPHRVSFIYPDQPVVLDEIPSTGIDTFKKFSSLAPSAQATPAAGSAGQGQPPPVQASQPAAPASSPPSGKTTRMKPSELGPLDMEKYLSHYSISYTVKEITHDKYGPATAYVLSRCLFNADHSGGEASIIVPKQGAFKYQCFHASCKSKTWKDAKIQISGEKNLAEFCHGYDPHWQPPKEVGTRLMADLATPMTEAAALQNGVASPQPVPQPADVDPVDFYERRGKRPAFVPLYLAKYLSAYLHPICSTNGTFYHYSDGLWKEFPKTQISQICVHAMKEHIQAAWIDNTYKILAGLVNREESEWPNNPHMLNVKNCMLDMMTREVHPHHPKWGSRTQLPVDYKPELDWSPRWCTFLDEIFPDDVKGEKKMLLMQYFGYCLLRDTRFQKSLFMYGTGANGKSTVIDVLVALVGSENTSSLTLTDLSKQFRAHFLQNKMVNVSTETESRDQLTTSVFKAVVDGSLITAERKYGEAYQFRSFAKWIVALNDPPGISDKSHGFGRRVIVLDFTRRFEDSEIKDRMAEYLIEELSGVLNYALDGLKMLLHNNGFDIGMQVRRDTAKLMERMNPMISFVKDCCEVDDSPTRDLYEQVKPLWHAYLEWCHEGRNRPMGRNNFYEQLQTTFTRVKKGRKEMPDKTYPSVFTGIHLTQNGREYAERGKLRLDRGAEKKY